MSRWYRAYSGTVRDDKLAECTVIAGCSRSVVIATWHAILESAADTLDGGRFETSARRVAAILGEALGTIEAVFAGMAEVGLIEGSTIPAWRSRQFESDSSTERSRKHRETKRNGDATLQQRSATPPYTETDTDTDTDTKKIDNPSNLVFDTTPRGFDAKTASSPVAFPRDGTIRYSPFAEIVRKQKPRIDPDVVAEAFRRFVRVADPPIEWDCPLIAKRFEGFVKSHRISH